MDVAAAAPCCREDAPGMDVAAAAPPRLPFPLQQLPVDVQRHIFNMAPPDRLLELCLALQPLAEEQLALQQPAGVAATAAVVAATKTAESQYLEKDTSLQMIETVTWIFRIFPEVLKMVPGGGALKQMIIIGLPGPIMS